MVKFGTDGTLYCNTIKYNYKQARNIVDNNCAGQYDALECWSCSSVSKSTVQGYLSGTCFKFSSGSGTKIMSQSCFQPTANHKYYGCIYWMTPSSSYSVGDSRFEWWTNDTNYTGRLTFASKNIATNGNWVLLSSIQTAGSSMSSGTWVIRNFLVNPTTEGYCCKMMIVDLTDTFGAGNEPTKAWCDANILEHKKLRGVGTQNVTKIWGEGAYSDWASFTALKLNSNWEPRCHMLYMATATSGAEVVMPMNLDGSLDKTKTYYIGSEVCDHQRNANYSEQFFSGNVRYQYYYPIAEPSMGYQKAITHRFLNGGGGMTKWRRVGVMNTRPTFSSGSQCRFDFDFEYYSFILRAINQNFYIVDTALSYYNSWFGCNASINDVNKEWCDRWLDGRNSPIIHIKDPNKVNIKFSVPIQEAKRTSLSSYTKSAVDSYVGLTNDTWNAISNTAELTTGFAYLSFLESTNNRNARFVFEITAVGDTSITTNNYGWGYEDTSTADGANPLSAWWQFVNGYDVECNDVEIRPEVNSISLTTTGTIICKKLVTNF